MSAKCGTLYNVASNPPKVDELCDLDGQKLIIRDDDREAVIREGWKRMAARPGPCWSITAPPDAG